MASTHSEKLARDWIKSQADEQLKLCRQDTSIVITGFMGTGKTSVGAVLASRMDRVFVDMDAIIQAREGKTVQEIFATQGEPYFRACEKNLCKELGRRKNLVVATGGGTLVDPRNRLCFRGAFVVCLDASVDVLLERLKNASDRPLLQRDEVGRRLARLLSTRRAAYEEIERHVDTTEKSVDQVATEIIALFRAGQIGDGLGAG